MASAAGSNWAAMREQLQHKPTGKPGQGSAAAVGQRGALSQKGSKAKEGGGKQPVVLVGGKRKRGTFVKGAPPAGRNDNVKAGTRLLPGKRKAGKSDKKTRKNSTQGSSAAPGAALKRGAASDSLAAHAKATHSAVTTALPQSQPPPPFPYPSKLAVLLPSCPSYAACLRHSYQGFAHDTAGAFPEALHSEVEEALEEMTRRRLFHYDIVSAGKAVSSTFCERTLLGDRGMTYHYQRLRIFAYPWEDKHTEEGSPFRALRRLNEAMVQRTNALLDTVEGSLHRGSAKYSITLINKMDAPERCKVALKDEGVYGMGPTSVSWHADSSLQEWSSIAVWQTTDNDPDAMDWHVAVRVAHDDVTPALRLPLKTRETYYMLNDFNHHHHHAVLAGKSKRYSSTHRVAVVTKDTWAYIKGRCQEALAVVRDGPVVGSNGLRTVGEVHIELELQWLRMFWIQGRRHAESHEGFWLPCMEKLERWWQLLEASLQRSLKALREASLPGGAKAGVEVRSYSMAGYLLEELACGRSELKKRCKALPYRSLPEDCRPVTDRPAPLRSEEAWQMMKSLRVWKADFMGHQEKSRL